MKLKNCQISVQLNDDKKSISLTKIDILKEQDLN